VRDLLHDEEFGVLAGIVDVGLIGDAEEEDCRPVQGLRLAIEGEGDFFVIR
jgi:hypothetical protein